MRLLDEPAHAVEGSQQLPAKRSNQRTDRDGTGILQLEGDFKTRDYRPWCGSSMDA
jgi:hypothetical protein